MLCHRTGRGAHADRVLTRHPQIRRDHFRDCDVAAQRERERRRAIEALAGESIEGLGIDQYNPFLDEGAPRTDEAEAPELPSILSAAPAGDELPVACTLDVGLIHSMNQSFGCRGGATKVQPMVLATGHPGSSSVTTLAVHSSPTDQPSTPSPTCSTTPLHSSPSHSGAPGGGG